MYYFSDNGKTKQYDDAKQYVKDYAAFIRSKFGQINFSVLRQIVNYIMENFEICSDLETSGEQRIAEFLNEKKGSIDDFADFLLLVLYGDKNVKAKKFHLLMANNMHGNLNKGSTLNPVRHVGICVKLKTEDVKRERYIDLTKCIDSMFDVEIFNNNELRKYYNFDYHFVVFSKIEYIKANNFDEYYYGIVQNLGEPIPRNSL